MKLDRKLDLVEIGTSIWDWFVVEFELIGDDEQVEIEDNEAMRLLLSLDGWDPELDWYGTTSLLAKLFASLVECETDDNDEFEVHLAGDVLEEQVLFITDQQPSSSNMTSVKFWVRSDLSTSKYNLVVCLFLKKRNNLNN